MHDELGRQVPLPPRPVLALAALPAVHDRDGLVVGPGTGVIVHLAHAGHLEHVRLLRGEVLEANTALAHRPEAVNSAPHDTWFIRVRVSNPSEVASLLSSTEYQALLT